MNRTMNFVCRVEIGRCEDNDDRGLADGRILSHTVHSGDSTLPLLLALCDGCGGYAGGGRAAETVLKVLREADPKKLKDENIMAAVLEECSQQIAAEQQLDPDFRAMCTTLAGAVFHEDKTIFFHAGDTRIYRFDGENLALMTRDHSVVRHLMDLGFLNEKNAAWFANRSTITRCLGAPCPPPEIRVSQAAIQPGEVYLICTDGLWGFLSGEKMAEILAGSGDLTAKAGTLINTALQNGSRDNLSVILCTLSNDNEKE